MNKEERKQKMDEFNEKMKELNAKIKDSTDILVLEGMEAKDVLGKKLKDAQSSLEATKEQCRIMGEKGKGKISSELIKAQMNLNVAKENIEKKKELHDKEKLAKYIDDKLEYAEQSVALSLLAAKEAKVAFLEALDAQMEYDEKYGEEE